MLTELGSKLLRKAGYDTGLWKRTGYQNFKHQLYSVLIAYAYKKVGQQVFIEKAVSEERLVDVLVSNGKQTAIEVELGSSWWYTYSNPIPPVYNDFRNVGRFVV